jgi:hypothetical protein
MKPNMRYFKRACCWVLVVESLFAGLAWTAYHNSDVALELLPFMLLSLLLNFPGYALARGLRFFGPWTLNPQSNHPVAGVIL